MRLILPLIAIIFSASAYANEPIVPAGWLKTQEFKPVVYSAAKVTSDDQINLTSQLSIQVRELKGSIAKFSEQLSKSNTDLNSLQIKSKAKVSTDCYQLTLLKTPEHQTWCFGKSKAGVLVESGPEFAPKEFYEQLVTYAKEQAR